MISKRASIVLLMATMTTTIAMAQTPILCPQTIQADCQQNPVSGVVECSLVSNPLKHFDPQFTNSDQHTGLVSLYFQKAHMVDYDALCEYKSGTSITATLSNKDNDSLVEDDNFPGNQWIHEGKSIHCHGPEAIYCPFNLRY